MQTFLSDLGISVKDLGPSSFKANDDYPDYAKKLCKKVTEKTEHFGVLICGSGIGMSIAANKVPKIRAALCLDTYSAQGARTDDDANVLILRARNFDHRRYKAILKTFFQTPFSEEKRHKRRIAKLESRKR